MDFLHFRVVNDSGIAARGGVTVCFEENADGDIEFGLAVCSIRDNYDKRMGRVKAEARLRMNRRCEGLQGIFATAGQTEVAFEEILASASVLARHAFERVIKRYAQYMGIGDFVTINTNLRHVSKRRRTKRAIAREQRESGAEVTETRPDGSIIK